MHVQDFIDPIAYWLRQICPACSIDIVSLLLNVKNQKIESKSFKE